MMKSIKSTVSTLHTLSATACLGEAVGLVRPGALMGCSTSTSLTSLCSIPTCESSPCRPRHLTCRMCRSLVPMCVFVVTSKWSRPPSARILVMTQWNKNGLTPLHRASESSREYVDLARFLVKRSADAIAQDNYGYCPLHRASFKGNTDIARYYLFEQSANATAPDKNGLTLLHWASMSRSGRVALAWILVEHGADVTAKDHLGVDSLAFSYASTFGHEELARFLVEHEVDSTAQPRTGLLRSIWHRLEILWNSYAPSSWRM